MTHAELVRELSSGLSLPRKEAARMLRALAQIAQHTLIAGHELHIRELGRFHRGIVAPRGSVNGNKRKPANVIHFRSARSFLNKMRIK